MGVVMKAAEQVALRVARVPVGDSYGKKNSESLKTYHTSIISLHQV